MKKIELHCHLDGSLSPEYASKLLGRDVMPEMVGDGSASLAEYLEKFALPIELLQTRENLTEFSRLLAKDLVKDEVIYAEIRFCPFLHTDKGLQPHTVVQAVLSGLRQVPEVKTNLILCMMRNLSYQENIRILELSCDFQGRGVCGLDLAGDEAAHPNSEFANLFAAARQLQKLPFTIHGGEAAGAESVRDALRFGAKRIGHGIHAIEDSTVIKQLIEAQVPLEICVSSNLDTATIAETDEHPVRRLFELGVPITINTDNRTVSNTYLEREYVMLKTFFGFTDYDLLICNLNAALGSFASDTLKVMLCRELLADYSAHCRQ